MLFVSSFPLPSTELLTQNFLKTPTNYVFQVCVMVPGCIFVYQLLQTFTETERNELILLESQYLGAGVGSTWLILRWRRSGVYGCGCGWSGGMEGAK